MAVNDKRIDAYIARAEAFAQPILFHIRDLVHKACPDVEETMKWSFPHFDYHGIMCAMACFKKHCAFGFWKASLMKDFDKTFNPKGETAMGHFGRLTSLRDLPSDKVLIQYIKEAMRLNVEGVKVKRKPVPKVKKKLVIPPEFKRALAKDKMALMTFDEFTYSQRKEYLEWFKEAKTAVTREKRIATAIEWLADGKTRNWKYK